MSTAKERLVIDFTKDDSLILFDWLARFNEGSTTVADEVGLKGIGYHNAGRLD